MSVRPSASVYNIILGSALAASSVFCIASIVAASSAPDMNRFSRAPAHFSSEPFHGLPPSCRSGWRPPPSSLLRRVGVRRRS